LTLVRTVWELAGRPFAGGRFGEIPTYNRVRPSRTRQRSTGTPGGISSNHQPYTPGPAGSGHGTPKASLQLNCLLVASASVATPSTTITVTVVVDVTSLLRRGHLTHAALDEGRSGYADPFRRRWDHRHRAPVCIQAPSASGPVCRSRYVEEEGRARPTSPSAHGVSPGCRNTLRCA
jgi:hypothetical protein